MGNMSKKTLEERASSLTKFGILVLEYWPATFLGIPPLLAIAIAIAPPVEISVWVISFPLAWLLGGLAAVFAIVGGVGSFRRRESLHMAQRENKQLQNDLAASRSLATDYRKDVQVALEFALFQMAVEVGLSDAGLRGEKIRKDVRLSLYCHHDTRNVFLPIARVAGNPLREKSGRAEYPDSQGVISMGWQSGAASMVDLPDDRDEWTQQLVQKHGFDVEEVKKLSMQSLSLVAFRLDDGQEKIGIVVAESENKRGITRSTLDDLQESEWHGPIASLITSVRGSLIPHLSEED